jgi:hypothetical protein
MQTFVLVVQKMPAGGYTMAYRLDDQDVDLGHAQAARSRLAEVMGGMVIPVVEQHFKEPALIYQVGQMPVAPVDDGTLPRVATGPEPRARSHEGGGLMDRLQDRFRNGSINLIVAAWLGMAGLGVGLAGAG